MKRAYFLLFFLSVFTFQLFFNIGSVMAQVTCEGCRIDNGAIGHCIKLGCEPVTNIPICDYNCNSPYFDCANPPVSGEIRMVGSFCCDGCANCMDCCEPVPTSTPTPTPTPTGIPSCLSLSSPAESTQPKPGDTISLTCAKNASYTGSVTYDYMSIHKNSSADANPVPTPTAFAKQQIGSTTFTFPTNQYGYYLLMCRICAGAFCSEWQTPSNRVRRLRRLARMRPLFPQLLDIALKPASEVSDFPNKLLHGIVLAKRA